VVYSKESDAEIGFQAETGELLMLNKKERILLKTILSKALNSRAGREVITQTIGSEYVLIGKHLLKEMGEG
jgi:hypothetical protein